MNNLTRALGLSAMMTVTSPFDLDSTAFAKPVAQNQKSPYTFVELLKKDETKPLEDILADGGEKIPTMEEKGFKSDSEIKMDVTFTVLPQILYFVKMPKNKEGLLKEGIGTLYFGTACPLTDEFFLLPAVAADKLYDGAKRKEDVVMLVYTPQTGTVSTGRILNYSNENLQHSIALGKLDAPIQFNPQMRIPKNEPRITDPVVTTLYGNIGYIVIEQLMQIIGSGEFIQSAQSGDSGDVSWSFRQSKPVLPDMASLKMHGLAEALSEATNATSGGSKLYILRGEIHPMNFGTPVYGLDGQLVGIVTHTANAKDTGGNPVKTMGFYGPSALRALLQDYVCAVKKQE